MQNTDKGVERGKIIVPCWAVIVPPTPTDAPSNALRAKMERRKSKNDPCGVGMGLEVSL